MLSTKIKIAFLTVVMISAGLCFAASTKEIDEVRKKTDFTADDLAVVDTFINQAFTEMLEAPTIADSVKSREDILVRKPRNDQPKYKEQYRKSIEANILSTMKSMTSWNDENFIKATRINLAVLIGSIDDVALYEIAITMINEDGPAVKYWSLKALTGSDVKNSVRQNPNSASSVAIIDQLKNAAQQDSPVIIEMITSFAATVNGQNSYDLLSQMAATRIQAYKNWTASHESTDARLLTVMGAKMVTDPASKATLAQPFASLMSAALQKYALSLAPDGGLGDVSQQQLITVIAELEKNVLPKLGITTDLIRAVERKNAKDFSTAYDALFGTDGAKGELSTKLGVDVTAEELPQR